MASILSVKRLDYTPTLQFPKCQIVGEFSPRIMNEVVSSSPCTYTYNYYLRSCYKVIKIYRVERNNRFSAAKIGKIHRKYCSFVIGWSSLSWVKRSLLFTAANCWQLLWDGTLLISASTYKWTRNLEYLSQSNVVFEDPLKNGKNGPMSGEHDNHIILLLETQNVTSRDFCYH